MIEMKKIFATIATAVIATACSNKPEMRIHTVGDSTMADYEEVTTEKRGWGEMLCHFVNDDAKVINYARGGRSTRSFYEEGLWKNVLDSIESGDYVLIQFAHNDEKDGGKDGDRGTQPWGSYQEYLRKYIDEAKGKGGKPVLVAPVVRCYFEGGKISAKGRHNLGAEGDTKLDYVAAMKSVAEEKGVPFIDMTTRTREIVEALGQNDAKKYIYVKGDNTHTQANGAIIFAQATVRELIKNDILVKYLKEAHLATNPQNISFGDIFAGTEMSYAFDVVGMGDANEEHTYTVTAPDGIKISTTPDGEQKSQIEINARGGVTLYAHVDTKEAKNVNGSIIAKVGDTTTEIPVKGNVNQSTKSGVVTAQIVALVGEVYEMKGMKIYEPTSKGLEVEGQAIRIEGIIWPADIDEDGNRYVEFIIEADKTAITVNNMTIETDRDLSYRVAWSRSKDFVTRTTIGEETSASHEGVSSFKTNISIAKGKKVYVRIFPWSREKNDYQYHIHQIDLIGISHE